MNYRLRQYMNILHSTELAEYVYGFDTRVTYDLKADSPEDWPFDPVVEGSQTPIYFAGRYTADESQGRFQAQYRVSLDGSTVTVIQSTPPVTEQSVTISVANGVTDEISLGRGLRCYVEPVSGSVWHITASGRPVRGLSEIADRLAALGEERMIQLFGANPLEPYKTFRSLWYDHPFLPYRLGGLILAAVSRTHDVWRKGV